MKTSPDPILSFLQTLSKYLKTLGLIRKFSVLSTTANSTLKAHCIAVKLCCLMLESFLWGKEQWKTGAPRRNLFLVNIPTTCTLLSRFCEQFLSFIVDPVNRSCCADVGL